MTIHWTPPSPTEHPVYYGKYIQRVPEGDLVDILNNQLKESLTFLESLPVEKLNYRYAAGKWTIPQIIQHITDTERIFAYRALRFARKDKTPLSGFEENDYADAANTSERSINDILEEFISVRRASIQLLKSFNDAILNNSGSSNGNPMTVRAMVYIIAGHELHHMQVIKEKYL